MDREPMPGPADAPHPPGHPLAPLPYVVRESAPETPDTTTLVVAPADGTPVPKFHPGQFCMLYAFGIGEIPIGLSGDPARPDAFTHTVRAVGKVSAALARAAAGSVIGLRGPYGSGWPVGEARGHDVLVVAGGLGFAPLRPVIYELFRERARFGRVEVVFGARSPKELLYYAEIQEWRRRLDARVQVTVDSAGREWYGDVGVVTTRLPDCRFDPASTYAFLCGPEIMMRLTSQALLERGLPRERIFLSMERNMKCAVGYCGHCQLGPEFICRDGPVFPLARLAPYLSVREL